MKPASFSNRLARVFARVAMSVVFGLLASCAPSVRAFDHSDFDAVLKAHVRAGRVDYVALKTEARLDLYLAALADAKSDEVSGRAGQLAFWINAYNAYTLKLVAAHYPVPSIRDIPHADLKSVWDLPIARVAGATYSLNQIEHEILRARLKEPRIHYAVVCAAVSCPPLRAEAYVGERLEEQLAEQARIFLATRNTFDARTRRAQLSQIFSWFAVDFGSDPSSVLAGLAPYAPEVVRASLTDASSGWSITYLDYDWALNDLR